MPTPRIPDHLVHEAAELYRQHGYAGHKILKVNIDVFKRRVKRAVENQILTLDEAPNKSTTKLRSIEIDSMPEGDLSLSELISLKKEISKRVKAVSDYQKLINVKVNIEGPIGLTIFGDPHVDDDSCDMETLERDLETVSSNQAMFAGHVGDLTNNWIGRLERKYGDQLATRRHAKMLLEWVLKGRPNLFVIHGNHDLWNNGSHLIDWAIQGQMTVNQAHGIRLNLQFPQGQPIRIHARHDFPGNSIYNDSHSLRRELAFGVRDHILLAGHRHSDAHAMVALPEDPFVSFLYRVSGYKLVDDYAEQNRFIEKRFAPSVTLIIDNEAPPPSKVKHFFNSEEGADYLKFLRSKKARINVSNKK